MNRIESQPETLNDAFHRYIDSLDGHAQVLGELDLSLLEAEVEFGFSPTGMRTAPGKWKNKQLSVAKPAVSLCAHRPGDKDGPALTPAC